MKRVHGTRLEARTTLGAEGYLVAFASPGRPELWVKPKTNSRMAVARQVEGADERWGIMPYPEPATATPAQAAELAKRDGVVLAAGVLPNEPDMTTSSVVSEGCRPEAPAAGNGALNSTAPAVLAATSDPDEDLL
jgi:hypothetical protein